MIKLGIKNYFKTYRWFFMPIGALALGIVIGLAIMVPMLMDAIKGFINGVAALAGNLSPDWGAVKDTVLSTFRAVDYTTPETAAAQVLNEEFFTGLLNACLHAALDTEAIAADFQTLLDTAMTKILTGAALLAFFTLVGAVVGYYVTHAEMRRNMAKRTFKKAILFLVVRAIINVTIIAAGVWLIMKINKLRWLAGIATILLYGSVSFFEAYLVHGYKKVSLKEVLRIRNVFSAALVSVIQFAISALLVFLVFKIAGLFVGVFINFSVIVLTMSCLSLNVEAYVKSMAEKGGEGALDKEAFVQALTELSPALNFTTADGARSPAVENQAAERSDGVVEDDMAEPSAPAEIPVHQEEIISENLAQSPIAECLPTKDVASQESGSHVENKKD